MLQHHSYFLCYLLGLGQLWQTVAAGKAGHQYAGASRCRPGKSRGKTVKDGENFWSFVLSGFVVAVLAGGYGTYATKQIPFTHFPGN